MPRFISCPLPIRSMNGGQLRFRIESLYFFRDSRASRTPSVLLSEIKTSVGRCGRWLRVVLRRVDFGGQHYIIRNRKRMTSYRPWGSLENGTIEFESLTTETLEGALTVMREAFCTDENVSVAVDLMSESGASEELVELCLEAVRDGVSVVAIDVTTGEVVGASFNKIQIRPENPATGSFQRFSERCKCKSSKALADYMTDMDSRVDMFEHFNTDCILEMMFLATKRSHRKRRIGELLVAASVEIGRQLNRGKEVKTPVEVDGAICLANADAVPSLISMLATSNYTKKIGDRAGLETLAEVSFDEYSFAGKKFSERIGSTHRFSWLMAKRLPDPRTRTISASLN